MLKVGDKILYRIPGLASKLEDSWEGPNSVVDRVGDASYKVKRDSQKGKKHKIIHINNAISRERNLLAV